MITLYNRHKHDPGTLVGTHFTIGEFWCKCGKCETQMLDTLLVDILESLRVACGNNPIKINSGYRCPAHNAAVGGAMRSQHLKGTGADIVVANSSPSFVGEKAVKVGFPGVKVYRSWVHVDVREGLPWHVLK